MIYIIIKDNKILGYGLNEDDVIEYAKETKGSVFKKIYKYDFSINKTKNINKKC